MERLGTRLVIQLYSARRQVTDCDVWVYEKDQTIEWVCFRSLLVKYCRNEIIYIWYDVTPTHDKIPAIKFSGCD